MIFTQHLINWYRVYQRDLPWRQTQNPYKIWLSEIILQQTRVAQGLPYYQSFINNFPTVSDLAKAEENQVLKLWQGLGYYSRARNLHETAKKIYYDHEGIFPTTFSEILNLKGIGPYTAAAIASFAFGEKKAVVDGNVFRVLARYFGIYDDISTSNSRTVFQKLADDLIQSADPATFNHAIMDFGATQCIPKNPDCTMCVMEETCYANRNGSVSELPVKLKKTNVRNRYFHFIIFKDDSEHTTVEQRIEKDIWQGLYQFPLVETQDRQDSVKWEEFIKAYISEDNFSERNFQLKILNRIPLKHKLSHQLLHLTFYECDVRSLKENKMNWEDVLKLPFPIVIWNFLKTHYDK